MDAAVVRYFLRYINFLQFVLTFVVSVFSVILCHKFFVCEFVLPDSVP